MSAAGTFLRLEEPIASRSSAAMTFIALTLRATRSNGKPAYDQFPGPLVRYCRLTSAVMKISADARPQRDGRTTSLPSVLALLKKIRLPCTDIV